MQARMGVLGQVKPGSMDDLLQRIQEKLYPLYAEQPGYQGALLLADRKLGRVLSITLWDEAGHLEAAEEATTEERMALAPFFAAQRLRETYEVVAQL